MSHVPDLELIPTYPRDEEIRDAILKRGRRFLSGSIFLGIVVFLALLVGLAAGLQSGSFAVPLLVIAVSAWAVIDRVQKGRRLRDPEQWRRPQRVAVYASGVVFEVGVGPNAWVTAGEIPFALIQSVDETYGSVTIATPQGGKIEIPAGAFEDVAMRQRFIALVRDRARLSPSS